MFCFYNPEEDTVYAEFWLDGSDDCISLEIAEITDYDYDGNPCLERMWFDNDTVGYNPTGNSIRTCPIEWFPAFYETERNDLLRLGE